MSKEKDLVKSLKKQLDEFIDYAFGSSGFVDVNDVKRHLFDDCLDLEDLADEIEYRDGRIETLESYADDLEKRPDVDIENLREQGIADRFSIIFKERDYKALDDMLDYYEILK